jgi:hypothetical protein
LNKGFIFSLEATIALIFLGGTLLFLFQPVEFSFKEVIILQQSNDLLKVWAIQYPNNKEAINDSKMLFGENVDLIIDGVILNKSQKAGERIVTNTIILDDFLEEHEFVIRVYTG